ncbi:MAG: PilX N-terminal domain-containing pilus assembly protein [Burkholderiaceae bacterium]
MRPVTRSMCRFGVAAPVVNQRGVAALVVTMTMFFAMLLAAVFANRNLVFEQRSSANQYRSTQAFEAAEAGLEWAQAQLNNVARIGDDCTASADESAQTFRDRYLRLAAAGAGYSAAQWNNAGVEAALQPACLRRDSNWHCSCPSNGHAQLGVAQPGSASPAFSVEFLPGAKAGVIRVVSRGCSSLGGVCAPGSSETTEAVARVEASLALLPGLASAPAAALTLRGGLEVGAAALGVHNADIASGAVALHAGADVQAAALRIGAAPGAATSSSVVSHDARLAALSPAQLFAFYFGLDRSSWSQQPVVTTLNCAGNCTQALQRAVAAAGTNALIWIVGNLDVEGPAAIGTRQQPALIVVEGSAQLRGAVTLHGMLYAGALRWDSPVASGAWVRGALVSESSYEGDGTPDLVYDPTILEALRSRSGMFARVSGSWRDF